MNINFQPFFCSGYVQTFMSPEHRKELDDIIINSDRSKQAATAGVQDDCFNIPEASSLLRPYVVGLANAYRVQYKDYTDEYETEMAKVMHPHIGFENLKMDDPWVNITSKNLYNPPHNHYGIYSYIIFHKIPFTLEEERKLPFHRNTSKESFPGCPYFIHPTHYGGVYVQNVAVDKGAEGAIILFPSRIHHGVNPFHSTDENRITIAGNVTV